MSLVNPFVASEIAVVIRKILTKDSRKNDWGN